MENYELDENGYKKSKLSLEDLDKYTIHSLAAGETAKANTAHPNVINARKKIGRKNVESGHLKNIRPLAIEASKEWHKKNPEKSKENGSVHGKKGAITNKENGNMLRLADLKIRQKRKEWSLKLLELGLEEFLPYHIEISNITHKQWNNIKSRSNLVIKTDKKGKIQSKKTSYFYKLNHEAINEAINDDLKFFK